MFCLTSLTFFVYSDWPTNVTTLRRIQSQQSLLQSTFSTTKVVLMLLIKLGVQFPVWRWSLATEELTFFRIGSQDTLNAQSRECVTKSACQPQRNAAASCQCYSIGGLFRSLSRSIVSRVVYCGQTVQDRLTVCIEVE